MAARASDQVTTMHTNAPQSCHSGQTELTKLRRAVFDLVLMSDRPQTAYQLLDRLREIRPRAAPPTVYRSLEFLVERQLVHKLERLNAYIACSGTSPQPHRSLFLICKTCRKVTELDDDNVALALGRVADFVGFKTTDAIVELEGVCADCA